MKAIIPVAGYATRLYPLTLDKPKALLEVQEKPIITYIIKKIEELQDVDEIYVVTNDKFYSDFKAWSGNLDSTLEVKLLNDKTTSNENRLGQIGDIQFAISKEKIDDDLLVIAGDNLFNFSLLPIYEFFSENQKCVNALYDIKSIESAKKLGIVKTNADNKIVSFEEKPPEPKTTNVSLGIYFFPKNKVGLIKEYLDKNNNPDKMGYFMAWAIKNHGVLGYLYHEKWFDVGWKQSLDEARKEFEG